MLSCLGMLYLTTFGSVHAEEPLQQVWIKPYNQGDFTYYTITQKLGGGWASMTGFESHKPDSYPVIRWLTAAHYFPVSLKPQVMQIELNGSKFYINKIEYLGHDVCIFRLGEDSTYLVKWFSSRGPGESFTAQMEISLFDEPLDKIFYLVDRRYYKLLGSITVNEPEGDIEGSLIDFASTPGDCGTSFLLEDNFLYVIVKGIPAGLEMPDGRILDNMTAAIRIELHP